MSDQAQIVSEPKAGINDLEVWAVFSSDESTHHIAGFLITDDSRMPALIAFVEGSSQVEMLAAKLISLGRRSPEAATDLRGRPIPSWLVGKPLIPMNPATGDPEKGFVGMFTAQARTSAALFTVIDKPRLKELSEGVRGKLDAASTEEPEKK